jgi:hypothetical protein
MNTSVHSLVNYSTIYKLINTRQTLNGYPFYPFSTRKKASENLRGLSPFTPKSLKCTFFCFDNKSDQERCGAKTKAIKRGKGTHRIKAAKFPLAFFGSKTGSLPGPQPREQRCDVFKVGIKKNLKI